MKRRPRATIPGYARKQRILTIYVNEERIEMLEKLISEYPESRSVSQALFRALGERDNNLAERVEALEEKIALIVRAESKEV